MRDLTLGALRCCLGVLFGVAACERIFARLTDGFSLGGAVRGAGVQSLAFFRYLGSMLVYFLGADKLEETTSVCFLIRFDLYSKAHFLEKEVLPV